MDKQKFKDIASLYNDFDYQGQLEQPEAFYHYTSIDTLLTILQHKKLRFTNRAYLNDSSEGKYVLSVCEDHIDELWSDEYAISKETFLNEVKSQKEIFDANLFKIFQLSLSTTPDNLSMWNYYAKGSGCNIQFSENVFNSLKKQLKQEAQTQLNFIYGKVIYKTSEQIELLRKIIQHFFSHFTPPSDTAVLFVLLHTILKMGIFIKHSGFEIENECRVAFELTVDNDGKISKLINPATNEPYKCEVAMKNGMLVPYVDVAFDAQNIQQITLSPTANFEKLKEGIEIALGRYGITDSSTLPIKQSEIPLRF